MPYPIDFVREHILMEFSSADRAFYTDYNGAIFALPEDAKTINDLSPKAYKKFMSFPLVRPHKFYVFYGAYPAMQSTLEQFTPLAVMGQSNAAIQRYAALPTDARVQDIYLWSPDAPYWVSEYVANGKTLPFHSYFILHLTAPDDNHTQVEVIEDQPTVKLGRKLSVDVHGATHQFNIQPVEPTTTDRVFLLSCIRQFMDRRVPGRHWFNCHDDPPPEPQETTP